MKKCCKFAHFGWGTSLQWLGETDELTDLHALNNFSSSIIKVSVKNSISLGLVLLEEKLFMQTPQSDAIMSADQLT